MRLRYGNFTHAVGETAIAIHKDVLRTEGGVAYAVTERWDVTGMLLSQSGSPIEMKRLIDAVTQAYSYDGWDLILLLPDGKPSSHALYSGRTIGGTRVVRRPSFPDGGRSQHVTVRTYTLAVEAEVRLTSDALLAFEEVVSFSGGGPRYGFLEPKWGPPVKQQWKRYTPFRAEQSGRAVGLFGYPAIPLPIWPAAMLEQSANPVYRSPRRRGSTYAEYEVTWHYQFASDRQMIGTPHRGG